jgi:arylsulfatase A-like enzyme
VAVRWKDWKYVLPRGPKGTAQLYDLAKDLGETTDVLAQHPDVVANMEKLVAEARADLGDGPDAGGTRRRPAGRVE